MCHTNKKSVVLGTYKRGIQVGDYAEHLELYRQALNLSKKDVMC